MLSAEDSDVVLTVLGGLARKHSRDDLRTAGQRRADALVEVFVDVRGEADDWLNPGARLTLHVIFHPGVLPPSDLAEAASAICVAFTDEGPS